MGIAKKLLGIARLEKLSKMEWNGMEWSMHIDDGVKEFAQKKILDKKDSAVLPKLHCNRRSR